MTEGNTGDGTTADSAPPFPNLLASLVAANNPNDGANRASMGDGQPAGATTLPGKSRPALSSRTMTASKASRNREPGLEAQGDLLATAGQTIAGEAPQPAVAPLAAGVCMPVPVELMPVSTESRGAAGESALPAPILPNTGSSGLELPGPESNLPPSGVDVEAARASTPSYQVQPASAADPSEAARAVPQPGADLPLPAGEAQVQAEGEGEDLPDGDTAAWSLPTQQVASPTDTPGEISDALEQAQAADAPALVAAMAGGDTTSEAVPAGLGTPEGQSHLPAQALPAEPSPANRKAAESGLAQSPAQALRRRSEDQEGHVPPDELAVRVAAPPVWQTNASQERMDVANRLAPAAQAAASPSAGSSGDAVGRVLALGGQASWTPDASPSGTLSRPPAESADGPLTDRQAAGTEGGAQANIAFEGLGESPMPAAGAAVRVLSGDATAGSDVAFAVEIGAATAPEDTVRRESPSAQMATEGKRPIMAQASPYQVAEPEAAATENGRPQSRDANQALARAGRERRAEPGLGDQTEIRAGASASKLIPNGTPGTQPAAETVASRPDRTEAQPERPQETTHSAAAPETPKTPLARDMKLEVTGGEQRVEIRLSERGGEVKLTVRTPDAELAGTLRENLPTLSARLAESGLKSEAWHPATSSGEAWRHTTESSASNTSQDSNTPSRQQEREPQSDSGQRHHRNPQQPASQKEKGKDFACLISTLR